MIPQFKNLHTLRNYFTTEQICWEYLEKITWGNTIGCPYCGTTKVYRCKDGRKIRCGESACKKSFNAKTGTIFMDTKIPLLKWFEALYVATSHKKGISSIQLGKDIGVTQKSAWFMLNRIRQTFEEKAPELLDGHCETDEWHHGGSLANMHEHKRQSIRKNGLDNKTKVVGVLDRNGKVLTHVPNKSETNEQTREVIKRWVKQGTDLYTDNATFYNGLSAHCTIQSVNHSMGEYVRGAVHTNTIEGFWSHLSRGIVGIYHNVSPKHLHRYCNEFSFRYNTRKMQEVERFDFALAKTIDRHITYPELIAKGEAKKGYRKLKVLDSYRQKLLRGEVKGAKGVD